jgi:energy-coupling factor transport system substrate-specific component
MMSGRKKGLRGWSTRDLLVVAALGVTLGVALVPVLYASLPLQAALGPLYQVLVAGLFSVPGLMALYVTRRPGAAVVNGVFVGLIQVPLTPFGWTVMIGALSAAVACELPFLATRYRRFGLPTLVTAGAVAALLGLALVYVPLGYAVLAPAVQIVLVLGTAVSGALLGGLLAKLLADALARTGVLSGYAVSRREEV